MMYTTEAEILSDAYTVQDAVNLSGVVHSFSQACSWLMAHDYDSATIKKHPAVVLFVDKIASMVDTNMDVYSTAYKLCKLAKEAREE